MGGPCTAEETIELLKTNRWYGDWVKGCCMIKFTDDKSGIQALCPQVVGHLSIVTTFTPDCQDEVKNEDGTLKCPDRQLEAETDKADTVPPVYV